MDKKLIAVPSNSRKEAWRRNYFPKTNKLKRLLSTIWKVAFYQTKETETIMGW